MLCYLLLCHQGKSEKEDLNGGVEQGTAVDQQLPCPPLAKIADFLYGTRL